MLFDQSNVDRAPIHMLYVAHKFSLLDITDTIYNFIICLLKDQLHVTRFASRTSDIAYINSSVVSGIARVGQVGASAKMMIIINHLLILIFSLMLHLYAIQKIFLKKLISKPKLCPVIMSYDNP